MTSTHPRVAFFPDSFHEVNGVAHTARHFTAFAARHNRPFFCLRAGNRQPALAEEGQQWSLELPRGLLSIALEKDLRFDPAFGRHLSLIYSALDRFQPEIIHITGPSEMGLIGALYAHRRNLPLAASWHTNVHEYAARRATWLRHIMPARQAAQAAELIEQRTLDLAARFYKLAQVLYAPNPQLCQLLTDRTGRPCHRMTRGVDAELFTPARRSAPTRNSELILGFVGRLSVEKNVALLARIHTELESRGISNFRFLIVGHGAEEDWLRAHLPRAHFAGVLRGEALARAYANMDLFLFPSHTDTFGNVVLEALASGVPAIVTPDGGPASIVRHGETGLIATDDDFSSAVATLIANPATHQAMRHSARTYALTASWDAVFNSVYAAYQPHLRHHLAIAG